ncbi:MAG: DUF1638 domain-containing protein [Actinomycetes bacterium]
MTLAVIACGALAVHIEDIAERNSLELTLRTIDPLFHNRPENIAPSVDRALDELSATHDKVVVAYADCGTYGALDEVCANHNVERLAGMHCYDVFATAERMRAEFEKEAGTFVLTDYLVKTFRRSVMQELGMDRYPELRDDYFHSYRRLLWLTQHESPELLQAAQDVSELIHLPLEIVHVGDRHLEEQLLALVQETR